MGDSEQEIRQQVEERLTAEQEQQATPPADDAVTPAFVRECFDANRLGDGTLFAAINKGRFVNNLTAKDEWYRWGGHFWELDLFNGRFSEGVEAVVGKYSEAIGELNLALAKARKEENKDLTEVLTKKRASVHARIHSLRDTGADKCLTWAVRSSNCLGIKGEEFDRNPWVIACRNGVVELKTGRHRDGRPGDKLTKASPHEWVDIDHPAPTWEAFLNEVFEGKEELIGFVRRFFGYGLTGVTTTHAFAILYGEGGRNGKGTLVETLQYVLGPLAGPIQSEMLLDQKNARSSSGPSPDIMSLKGLRVAFASETDEGRRFSASKIKWLSGGDTLTGRNPHDKYETRFDPTHLLCLLTNHLPHAPADDLAFWDRMMLIPFNIRFVLNPQGPNERPRQEGLVDKLKSEASGILAWLVRGCLEWQREGLNPPDEVKNATAQYQFREDDLGNFIAECCEPAELVADDCREQFKIVYYTFEHWYEQTIGDKRYCPKKKKFSQLMEKRFKKLATGGKIWFYGLAIKPEARVTPDQAGSTDE